jgi:hypothetical protein
MDESYPAFESAVSRFQDFLAAQGWPRQVVWITPGDTRLRRRQILIRYKPAVGEVHAREIYSRAASARLGVMLEAVCHVGGHSFARVVRPLNEDASLRGLFTNGLKLSVLENPLRARIAKRVWPLFSMASRWPVEESDLEA